VRLTAKWLATRHHGQRTGVERELRVVSVYLKNSLSIVSCGARGRGALAENCHLLPSAASWSRKTVTPVSTGRHPREHSRQGTAELVPGMTCKVLPGIEPCRRQVESTDTRLGIFVVCALATSAPPVPMKPRSGSPPGRARWPKRPPKSEPSCAILSHSFVRPFSETSRRSPPQFITKS
jgi:hypothetical protein